jgi:hypothetical protein
VASGIRDQKESALQNDKALSAYKQLRILNYLWLALAAAGAFAAWLAFATGAFAAWLAFAAGALAAGALAAGALAAGAFVAGATLVVAGLLALFAGAFVAASPHAIPKAPITRTAESAINFFILFKTPIFLKE